MEAADGSVAVSSPLKEFTGVCVKRENSQGGIIIIIFIHNYFEKNFQNLFLLLTSFTVQCDEYLFVP